MTHNALHPVRLWPQCAAGGMYVAIMGLGRPRVDTGALRAVAGSHTDSDPLAGNDGDCCGCNGRR